VPAEKYPHFHEAKYTHVTLYLGEETELLTNSMISPTHFPYQTVNTILTKYLVLILLLNTGEHYVNIIFFFASKAKYMHQK
jgi:hypothetical protein